MFRNMNYYREIPYSFWVISILARYHYINLKWVFYVFYIFSYII